VDATSGARLVRNDNYWQPDLPYLDAAEWTIVNDTQTSLAAFRAGDFDMHAVDAIDLASLEGDDNIAIDHFTAPSYMVAGLGGPIDVAPMDNPMVRQAIDLAIDRTALGQVVYPGGDFQLSTVFGHPVWSLPNAEVVDLPGYRSDKDADRTEAMRLLDAAGFGDGLKLTVSTTPDFPSFHIDRAQVYKAHLAEIGIDLEISTDEYAAYKDKERAKRFQLSTGAWAFSGDPDAALSGAFSTDGARNYFSYSDPDYEAMIAAERETLDLEERQEIVFTMQRKLLEDRPVSAFNAWFLFQDMGRQSYVKGLRLGGLSHSGSNAGDQGYQLSHIWLDK
jgi:ABC-type transport system substrate-binding protein